jgi:hypothetical protein
MDLAFDFKFRLSSRDVSVCECDDAFNAVDARFPPTGTARELCRRWNAYPKLVALADELRKTGGPSWLSDRADALLRDLGEREGRGGG